MKINLVNVRAFEISDVQDSDRLDPIQVFLQDIGPGTGRIVVECYGQAWSAYFGGAGDKGIHEFLKHVDSHYLTNKMRTNGCNMTKAGEKRHEAYLLRIVDVVLRVLKDPELSVQAGLSSLTRETEWSKTYFIPFELGDVPGGEPGEELDTSDEDEYDAEGWVGYGTLEEATKEAAGLLADQDLPLDFCVVRTTHEVVYRTTEEEKP